MNTLLFKLFLYIFLSFVKNNSQDVLLVIINILLSLELRPQVLKEFYQVLSTVWFLNILEICVFFKRMGTHEWMEFLFSSKRNLAIRMHLA